MVKRRGVKETLEFCQSNERLSAYVYRRESIDKPRLSNFTTNLKDYLDQDNLQIRAEGSHFHIYCKDTELYKSILEKLSGYISTVYEPASNQELEYMISHSHKKVMCNQLPYEVYQYKLYFKPGCDADTKRKFSTWIANYSENVKIPNGTFKWFLSGWTQGPYIYIKNQSTLSMIGLFMGHNVHKVEEFILRSSINITLDQEKLCQDSVSA